MQARVLRCTSRIGGTSKEPYPPSFAIVGGQAIDSKQDKSSATHNTDGCKWCQFYKALDGQEVHQPMTLVVMPA